MHLVALTQFAESSAGAQSGGVFGALGIDWQMLVFQIIGFLVLVWVMGKFVYPILMKQVDQRQDAIEASLKAAHEAEAHASSAQEAITKQLAEARKEAKEIVLTAKEEADAYAKTAQARSKQEAERIVAAAQEDIAKEVVAAKKALHNETIDLVALATEKVVGKTINAGVDAKAIKAAVRETSH